jgi:hypothetical protein
VPIDLDQCTSLPKQVSLWSSNDNPSGRCNVSDILEAPLTDETSSLLEVVQRRSASGGNSIPAPHLRVEPMPSAAADQWREDDPALVKAIATGLLISVPIWALFFGIIWSISLLARG